MFSICRMLLGWCTLSQKCSSQESMRFLSFPELSVNPTTPSYRSSPLTNLAVVWGSLWPSSVLRVESMLYPSAGRISVIFCLHPSSLIPNFELVRHCPSTWKEQTLFAARSAASFISLSLWLHTRSKVLLPGVSWALVFFFPSTAPHLRPCHLSGATMPPCLAFPLASLH